MERENMNCLVQIRRENGIQMNEIDTQKLSETNMQIEDMKTESEKDTQAESETDTTIGNDAMEILIENEKDSQIEGES